MSNISTVVILLVRNSISSRSYYHRQRKSELISSPFRYNRPDMPSIPLGTTFAGPNGETFKITDFLGQGAFGEVYRAAGETSGTVVAVKLLPLGSLADPGSKLALMNEMRAAEKIKHPNVVEVLY